MKFSFTLTGFYEFLEEFRQQTGSDYQLYGCETRLALPKKLGEGMVRNVRLRDGLDLMVSELLLEENLILECLDTTPESSQIISFKFYLSGLLSGSIRGLNGEKLASPGACSIIYWPEGTAGTAGVAGGSKVCNIELAIAPELLKTMM
ncbi:MAG: hypothetical protein F6K31_20075, partial [Symploca sp. SIO2G7]|nr:hypothetical protein [Symploca sp. SIO2G7]